jgi:anti-sigma factor RsiW
MTSTIDPTPRVAKIKNIDAALAKSLSPKKREELERQREVERMALRRSGFNSMGQPLQPLSA